MPSSETEVRTTATLPAEVPLHARPAGDVGRAAAQFPADISVAANGRRPNAKSILEILALGALGGTELVIAASGDRAAEAAEHLAGLVPQLG